MNTIKAILVDDHAVVRAGFRLLLSNHPSITVIDEAERGEQVLELLRTQSPAIIVMDLSMPGIGGLETIRRVSARDNSIKILVFSVHDEQAYIIRAIEAGAHGYITKNSAPEILAEAIEKIINGKIYIEEGLRPDPASTIQNLTCSRSSISDRVDALTAREFDIFLLMAKGKSPQIIADELYLSYKTVANYCTRIKKKLQADNLIELEKIALALDLIER